MAAEADIQVAICETRGEQVGNFVDNIINTSMSKLSNEKYTRDEQLNEYPIVEGENFLKPPSTAEVHLDDANSIDSPLLINKLDDQLEIQQNDEEANSREKDGDKGGTDSSVVISQMKEEDKLDDDKNYSITQNIALTKEIVQETSLPSESQAPLITEGEGEEKPAGEDQSGNLTSEVSAEEEIDQCKTTSEQEVLANERIAEDSSDTAAQEVSQGSGTPTEGILTIETSNNDELQSKSDLNSFPKEEEATVQNGDKIGSISEDSGVPLENTLSESHGNEECQSKNLEDVATDHSIPNLAEKAEETSLVHVQDSQTECDEHLKEESGELPSTDISENTYEYVPPATHNVKDKEEDLIEAELSKNEPSTKCLPVEEDRQIETPAETLLVNTENDEVSLSQRNSIQSPPEEQRTNATLHGNTIEAEEATIDAHEGQKESLEGCPPIVSSSPKVGSTDAVLQEVSSDHVDVLENLSNDEAHTETNSVVPDLIEVTEEPDQTLRDGTDTLLLTPKNDQKVEFTANEKNTYVEEIQLNAEESTRHEKDGNEGAVPEECSPVSSVTLDDPDVVDGRVATQPSKDTSVDQHETNNFYTENIVHAKEILEETNIKSQETESHAPCIGEEEELKVQAETTDNKSEDEKTREQEMSDLRCEVSEEGESDQNKTTSEQEVLENERSVDDNSINAAGEISQEDCTSSETITTLETSNSEELQSKSESNSSLSEEQKTTVEKDDGSVTTSEDNAAPPENTLSESECQSKNLDDDAKDQSFPNLAEKAEETSLVQVQDSQIECDEHLEEEEKLPSTDISTGNTYDNVPSATHNVKDKDEDLKEAELSENEPSTICLLVEEDTQIETPAETLPVNPENDGVSNSPPDEQSTNATPHGSTLEAEEATIDAQKEGLESFPPIVSSSPKEGSMTVVLQQVTCDHADVPENLSIDEARAEINNAVPDITKVIEEPDQKVGFVANEATSMEDIQLNAEDSNSNEKDGNGGVVSEQCSLVSSVMTSEVKARDTLDDDATDHSFPNLAEKAEETSLVQVQDSQVECDEHLKEETEELRSTDVSMVNTFDNVPPATHNVKDKDEDLIEAELSKNEPSTRCLLVEEDRQIETPAETLLVNTENEEASNLSQRNSIQASPEEQSTNETLHGKNIEAEEATIDAVDGQKEGLESCPPIVSSSSKEGSMNAVLQEVTSDHVDVPEILLIDEACTEINNVVPDLTEVTEEPYQKVGFSAIEEASVEEIQLNAEESNNNEKDGNGGVVPEQCSPDSSVMTSEEKAGDTVDDPDVDDEKVVTQISKDKNIDQHETTDSNIENFALLKEETNIPSEETESHTPCIREVEELDVHLNTIENKSEDEKTTEQDISCDLRSEVSKEGESDENKTTSECKGLENERSVEDNLNDAARQVCQEDSKSIETIATLEASNIDELQSKGESNSSVSKEQETTVEKGDRSVTASEDCGVPLENTLIESHGDEECQSKSLEDDAKDNSIPNLAEKPEETSLVEVQDSQIECGEHVEEESEKFQSTEVSTEATNDNVPLVTDTIEDKDEDIKDAELSENACTSVKEDGQIESQAESLLVAPEDVEVSSSSQESANATLHGNTNAVEEATIDAVDAVENVTIGEAHSEIINVAPDISEVTEKPDQSVEFQAEEEISAEEIQHTAEEVNIDDKALDADDAGVVTQLSKDSGSNELGTNDSSTENISLANEILEETNIPSEETESQAPCITESEGEQLDVHVQVQTTEDKHEDEKPTEEDNSSNLTSELTKEQEVLASVEDNSNTAAEEEVSQENSESTETITALETSDSNELQSNSESKEDETVVQKSDRSVTTSEDYGVPSENNSSEIHGDIECQPKTVEDAAADQSDSKLEEKLEESSLSQTEDSQLECDEHVEVESERLPLTETPTEVTSDNVSDLKEVEFSENEQSKEDVVIEDTAESLHVAAECIEESDVRQENKIKGSLEEQSTNADLHGNTIEAKEDSISEVVDQQKGSLENVVVEENSETQVDCSEREDEECLEKDSQNSSLTEAIMEETNSTDVEKHVDSLPVEPEHIEQNDSSPDKNNSIEEQILNTDPPEIPCDNAEREPVDVADTNEESLEAEGIAKTSEGCEKEVVNDESTKNSEGGVIKNEEFIESLEVAAKDVEAPVLGQDTETSCLDEKSPIANTEAEVDITDDANGLEDETPTDKQVIVSTKLFEGKEDCLRLEQNEDLGSDSEITPSTEAPKVNIIESGLVEGVEKSVEGQIETADPQETCDKTQEKTVDAADAKDDVVADVPLGDNEDNSPFEVDVSQNPETPAEKINDEGPTAVHEANYANEEEKERASALVKEEVCIESLQAVDEDLKATSSVQDREASYLEEQAPTTDSKGTGDHKDGKEEKVVEEEKYAATTQEDTSEDSSLQVDGTLLEQKEHSDKDDESISLTYAPTDTIVESREVAEVEDPIDSSKVTTEDIQSSASCQDTEIAPAEKQILDVEDISSNIMTEKTIEATSKETQEAKDIAKSVPCEEDSPNVEDGPQKSPLEEGSTSNIDERESTTTHVVKFVENEEATESTLVNEDLSIVLPQVEGEDIKEPCLNEVTETNSQEEQILSADLIGPNDDSKETKAIDPMDFQTETPKDEETSSNLTAEKTPCAEDLDVKEGVIGHIPEVSNYKQQEASITEVLEEHAATSDEHVSNNNSLESEVSIRNNDQVVGEASCDGKTDSEKIQEPNDGSTAIPINETLAETDSRGSTEAEVQVPNGENDAELLEADTDQKSIEETLLHNVSKYVAESEEVKDEVKTDATNCDEISSSSNTVASQEVSTSNVEIEEETETEEPQKQDRELQVSELIQDSSVENVERDPQLGLASPSDSGITEEVQKLEEVPLPAQEENALETTDCKESEVMEGATNNEDIDHSEQSDTQKSFPDDKRPTEEVLEERVVNDILPSSPSETSGVDHCATDRELTNGEGLSAERTATGDDEKEVCEETISDISSAAPDIIQARETDVVKSTNISDNIITEGKMVNENTSVECIIVNERSATYLEAKNGDEAPEIEETNPSSAEGKDVEGANVEIANYPGSLAEEKSNSDEVAFATGENKSGCESSNQVPESIVQADKTLANETLEQEEILKDDISSEKEQFQRSKAEDEDKEAHCQSSREEEVIRDSHQEDEIKQEQQNITKETVEFIEDGSQTEMISGVSEEAKEKALEGKEEKILTNEAIDKILHQEEQAKSIEERTAKIDTVKAQELAIASLKTDIEDSNKEGVQVATIPGKEIEEQNNKDEICSFDEVQTKDEENIVLSEGKSEEEAKETDTTTKPNEVEDKELYIEAKKLDFVPQTEGMSSECEVSDGAHIPDDNEISTAKSYISEEDHPSKSTEVEVSSTSEDIVQTDQASEASIVTAEVQEAKAGIHLGAAATEATEIESREVEEVNGQCEVIEETLPPVISTSKIIEELTVGTPLVAEDQQTKVHALPHELNIKDSEVKMAEKDDVVNLQSVRDISEDVQGLPQESLKVSNNENPVGGDLEEKMEIKEPQEKESVQHATVSETLEQETEEQQLGRGTESSIHQSYVEDTAQHEKGEECKQIDSPLSLPQAQEIKTSEKDLPVHVAGLDRIDAAEQEVSPLLTKDKHVVLEADGARNLNHENLGGDKNISTEHSQCEPEKEKPPQIEKEEAECGNEERKDQEREDNSDPKETDKPSLSDLFQVSMRGITQNPATEKEPTSHTEDLCADNSDEAEHENSKTDEEKDGEDDSHEQQKPDSVSEAPVMVDMGDADVKVAHKKSHNILSGVGSKVKHSIAKVKKAITGKSSHPKPPSPKKVTN